MKKITISQIADLAGVSKTTVSRVINNKKGVGDKKRAYIKNLILQNDYYPNIFAQAITHKKSKTIGLLIPEEANSIFSNPYYSEILRGVYSVAKEHGYYMIVAYAYGDDYKPLIKENRVDGIVVASVTTNNLDIIEYLKSQSCKFVVISNISSTKNLSYVSINDVDGACQAIEYLISLGHKKIGFINGPKSFFSSRDRFKGYKKTITEHGLEYKRNMVKTGNSSIESGKKKMKELIKNTDITAVFVASDLMAIGAISSIKEAGLSVPKDISVIGFDDIPFAPYVDPPLTTIRQAGYDKGNLATNTLINLIENKTQDNIVTKLLVNLVIRESTCPPRN